FSSRRRHTRFSRDWSSDVCSSDLDLKGVVDRAVEAKLQESIRAGRPIPLSTRDLLTAAKAARPTSVREWMATARNYVMHANESGAWDELMPYIQRKW